MFRVILILVVALISVLLLSACGGGGQEKAQEEEAQQPSTTEEGEGKAVEAPEDEQLECQIEQATAGMSEEEAVSYDEALFGEAKDKLGFVEIAKTKEEAQERIPQLQAEQKRILAERGFTC
jgi:uncharacterized lipoprotein YehR (DUF1307 family)